jgi:hypothetical protein
LEVARQLAHRTARFGQLGSLLLQDYLRLRFVYRQIFEVAIGFWFVSHVRPQFL